MQEKYSNISTYVFCANNPEIIRDLDGKEWKYTTVAK